MHGLLQTPGNHAHIVVAVTQDVVTSREAMLRAFLLHLIELLHIKLMVSDRSPIVRRRIHREAGGEGAIGAND